jgi:hypothetical protein
MFNTGRQQSVRGLLKKYTSNDTNSRWQYFFITQRNNLNLFPKTGHIQWKR